MLAAGRSPEACPALVLNADHRPLSYFPLSLWSWQDAIKAVFLDRVNILAEYDRAVRSPSFEMRLPSVVSLKSYVKPARNPAFTRFNVFLRVTACAPCNLMKGGRLPQHIGMFPRILPHRPSVNELRNNGRRFPPNHLHESWADYLYWDSELEP